jgi:hypothetical protein
MKKRYFAFGLLAISSVYAQTGVNEQSRLRDSSGRTVGMEYLIRDIGDVARLRSLMDSGLEFQFKGDHQELRLSCSVTRHRCSASLLAPGVSFEQQWDEAVRVVELEPKIVDQLLPTWSAVEAPTSRSCGFGTTDCTRFEVLSLVTADSPFELRCITKVRQSGERGRAYCDFRLRIVGF